MSSRNTKKKPKARQQSRSPSPDSDDDDRVLFYIPSLGINIEVLLFYLKIYLGDDSDAEPGQKPRSNEIGYYIKSRYGLSSAMVADLKRDSAYWKEEQRSSRVREYSKSETAKKRLQLGASGQKTIPAKTAQREAEAAQRSESSQPQSRTNMMAQRHDSEMAGAGGAGYSSFQPTARTHQDPTPGRTQATTQYNPNLFSQQEGFSTNYPNQTSGQIRPPVTPAYNLNVSVNTASFQSNPQRHQSPPAQGGNLMSSIEGRSGFFSPAPPYEEEEDRKESQPSTTGTHGFSHYSTAGPRHERR